MYGSWDQDWLRLRLSAKAVPASSAAAAAPKMIFFINSTLFVMAC